MHAATMSGGNQQKVVIAKWLATDPQLLIIDEPTRGIDVGTKAEVHRLLSELAGQGMAILMISSELPEVLGMADRVLVVCEGRITADLDRARRHPGDRHARRHPDPGGARMSGTSTHRPERRRRRRARRPRWSRRAASHHAPRLRDHRRCARARSSIALVLLLVIAAATVKTPSFLFSANSWRDLLLTPAILSNTYS